MPRLVTHLDTRSDAYLDNAAHMGELVGGLRERLARAEAGGGPESVERHRKRGKLLARERIERLIDHGAAFLELSALAADGLYDGDAPGAGIVTGIGPVHGRPCMVVANDATVKGGTLLPDDGQEAPARAGDRRSGRPAVHLPGRLRRRVPAAAGGGLPRPRPLRPDLLQPGPHVRRRHPADRRGDGFVHGRRRVRAGDVRRDGDRQGHGHDLPGRPAAGEGGDR